MGGYTFDALYIGIVRTLHINTLGLLYIGIVRTLHINTLGLLYIGIVRTSHISTFVKFTWVPLRELYTEIMHIDSSL